MFWIGTILAFTGAFRDKNSEPPPFLICCVMLIITLVGTYFLIALSSGLKKVKLTENHLLVSGLFRQEIVPLETIELVEGDISIGPYRIKIRFSRPTAFGKTIWFIPKQKKTDLIVQTLQEAVAKAKSRQTIQTGTDQAKPV
jgi:hypothetical protein